MWVQEEEEMRLIQIEEVIKQNEEWSETVQDLQS